MVTKLVWDLAVLVVMAVTTVGISKLAQDPSVVRWPFVSSRKRTAHEKTALGLIVPRESLTNAVGPSGLEGVAGYDEVKTALLRSVVLPLRYPHVFFDARTPSIRPPSGVLLHGPPGTGKTVLARACAYESNANFLPVDASAIENKWYGETPKLLKAIFDLARTDLAPCIVFLDEIDSMGRRRTERDQGHEYSLKCELLRHMDAVSCSESSVSGGGVPRTDGSPPGSGRPVVVIGCTNTPQSLDEALSRRFPMRVRVGLPSREERVRILRSLVSSAQDGSSGARPTAKTTRRAVDTPVSRDCDDLCAWVADMTEGFSGADLKETFREACALHLWGPSLVSNGDMEASIRDAKDGLDYLKRTGQGVPHRCDWLRTRRLVARIGHLSDAPRPGNDGEETGKTRRPASPPKTRAGVGT